MITGSPAWLEGPGEEGPALPPHPVLENPSVISFNEALLVREGGAVHPNLGLCSGIWRDPWDFGGLWE